MGSGNWTRVLRVTKEHFLLTEPFFSQLLNPFWLWTLLRISAWSSQHFHMRVTPWSFSDMISFLMHMVLKIPFVSFHPSFGQIRRWRELPSLTQLCPVNQWGTWHSEGIHTPATEQLNTLICGVEIWHLPLLSWKPAFSYKSFHCR